jgi:hypothetical protein
MAQVSHRGIVAIVLSVALGTVLVVLVIAIALGVEISEVGRSAAWARAGALGGALISYLSATSNGKPPTK